MYVGNGLYISGWHIFVVIAFLAAIVAVSLWRPQSSKDWLLIERTDRGVRFTVRQHIFFRLFRFAIIAGTTAVIALVALAGLRSQLEPVRMGASIAFILVAMGVWLTLRAAFPAIAGMIAGPKSAFEATGSGIVVGRHILEWGNMRGPYARNQLEPEGVSMPTSGHIVGSTVYFNGGRNFSAKNFVLRGSDWEVAVGDAYRGSSFKLAKCLSENEAHYLVKRLTEAGRSLQQHAI